MFKSFQVGRSADGAAWFQVWGDDNRRLARGKAPTVADALAKIGVVPADGAQAPCKAILDPPEDWQAQARAAGWVPPEDCDTLCGEVLRLTLALQAAQAAPHAPASAEPVQPLATAVVASPAGKVARQSATKRDDSTVSGDPVAEYLMSLRAKAGM